MNFLTFLKPKIKVITHSGSFHADEVFACATLSIWAEQNGKRIEIKRTRDEKEFPKADILVDVGMEYAPEKNHFDHHQKGGAGFHENISITQNSAETKIPYASFGLVWKHFGEKICASREVAEMIEKKLVTPVDAIDNGINTTKILIDGVPEYRVTKELIFAFRPTWQEEEGEYNKKFFEYFNFMREVLENEIRVCKSIVVGEKLVREQIKNQNEPEILILERDLPWESPVCSFPKIKLVVYPKSSSPYWYAETAMDNLNDYDSHRVSFPTSWFGLRDEELVKASGIKDAIFCHRAGFLAVANSKEAALEMARKALVR